MTVVGILGMTHDPALQEKYHFPLSLVRELILEFDPDVICGEVHPRSFALYRQTGDPHGILGETQDEYPNLIYPLCEANGITFVPVDWFEEDVFEEEHFDHFDGDTRSQLAGELETWRERQLASWDQGAIPLNSHAYDQITEQMYQWLYEINPDMQDIQWNARHSIMLARVKQTIRQHPGQRILCIHGADHNYRYHPALRPFDGVELVYPLR